MEDNRLDIGFVLLHCVSGKTTQRAINSIISNIDTENYKIIIVNQGFENSEIETIEKNNVENEKVCILYNSENLGFAAGNNIGIKYLRKKYISKFLVLMNNDVILLENNLYKKLYARYTQSKFGVAGPLIISGNGWCTANPGTNKLKNVKEIENTIHEYYTKRILVKLHLKYLLYFWIKIQRATRFKKKNIDFMEHQNNVLLHGCFLILTEEYFKVFDGLDNRTFLYVEEELLQLHCLENKIKMEYIPNIWIYHEEDAETDKLYKSTGKKLGFMYSNYIKSYKVLLETRKHYFASEVK